MPLFNPPITVQDEGTTQGTVETINFTGSAVTASVSGSTATVNITGGGGAATITQVEIDFGSIPTRGKTFIVTDAGVSSSSSIVVCQAGNAATGKQADENEMDPIIFLAIPGTGQFTLIGSTKDGPVVGKFKVNYMVG